MSIINEALKKVEKQRDQAAEKPAKDEARPTAISQINTDIVNAERKKTLNPWVTRMIIAGACIFVLSFVVALIINPPHRKGPLQYSQNVVIPPGAAAGNMPQAASNRSGFKLSGIMLSEEGPVAIINNEIVKKGDTINGATVDSIEEFTVKLSTQGQEFTLTVK